MDMEADVKMFNVNVSFLPCISPLLQCVNNTSSLDPILTWAAMTRCLSAMSVHLAQRQSRHLQYLLCPFSADTCPWLRHRAHFGVLWYLSLAWRNSRALDRLDIMICLEHPVVLEHALLGTPCTRACLARLGAV